MFFAYYFDVSFFKQVFSRILKHFDKDFFFSNRQTVFVVARILNHETKAC